MKQTKQKYILFLMLIAAWNKQAHAALANVSIAGDVANTYAQVARAEIESFVRQASGIQAGEVTGVRDSGIMVNVDVAGFIANNPDLFTVDQPQIVSSSDDSSGSSTKSALQESQELREATQKFFDNVVHNQNLIAHLKSVVRSPKLQNALVPVSSAPSSAAKPVRPQDFADALAYSTARQQYAYLANSFASKGVVPEADIEILAPVEANGIVLFNGFEFAPYTYEIEFLDNQRLYLIINKLASMRGSSVSEPLIEEILEIGKKEYDFSSVTGSLKRSWASNADKVKQSLSKIKDNFGKIQQAVVETLKAQGEAEAKAQAKGSHVFDLFKEKYDAAKDQGLFNRFTQFKSWAWGGKGNPTFNETFKGGEIVAVKNYVEGALETVVYDIAIYSSIVKMSENPLSTEFAKLMADPLNKKMMMFMFAVAGALSGTSAALDDSPTGLKNRVKAAYLAMQVQLDAPDASSKDLIESFAGCLWYVVAGKGVALAAVNPKLANHFNAVQKEVEVMIANPQDKEFTDLVPLAQLVAGAILDVTAVQVYSLDFKKPLAEFMADVAQLNTTSPNPSLQRIVDLMPNDPAAAEAVRAQLFKKAETVSVMDKGKYFAGKFGDAVKGFVKKVSGSAPVSGGQAALEQSGQESAHEAVLGVTEAAKIQLGNVVTDVRDGKISDGEAVKKIQQVAESSTALVESLSDVMAIALQQNRAREEAATILHVAPNITLPELTRVWRKLALELHPDKKGGDTAEFQRAQAAYEVMKEEPVAMPVRPGAALAIESMQETLLAEYAEQMNALLEAAAQALATSDASMVDESQEKIAQSVFGQQVRGLVPSFMQYLKTSGVKQVTLQDVQNLFKQNRTLYKGRAIGSREMKFVQGYVQALALMGAEAPVVSISTGEVVSIVDVLKDASM